MSLDMYDLANARIRGLESQLEAAHDELAEAELTIAELHETISSLTVEIQRMVADRTYVAA